MKPGPLLTLTLLLAAGCATRTSSQPTQAVNSNQNARPTAEGAQPAPSEIAEGAKGGGKETDVPPEFKGVDFENFSYPIAWKGLGIHLKGGEYEYYQHKQLNSNGWFWLGGVNYVDLTGDGKKEAVVGVTWIDCGASCDGGSHLFYVYSSRNNKPVLLWRIETGSLGYGCGLKSFSVAEQKITVEVFKNCHLEGASLVSRSGPVEDRPVGKFDSENTLTRLLFEFDGKSFGLKEREVFPYPQADVKNYPFVIKIGDE